MNDRGTSSSEAAESANSFAWRGGQERQTTGIWMWSEPFLRTPKGSSEQVAVLLMDTQGMFDNETSMSLTAQIFGLSTFVSSFQVRLILSPISIKSYHLVFSKFNHNFDTTDLQCGETYSRGQFAAPSSIRRIRSYGGCSKC
jgi:hypothetical protein